KFTFSVQPADENGQFTAVIPGAFRADSVRVLNPENVHGDISVTVRKRTKWIPSQLEALSRQSEQQARTVSSLLSQKSALEQTLTMLKTVVPEKSNPQNLLEYYKQSAQIRRDTGDELAEINAKLDKEQEKLDILKAEFNNKLPRGSDSFVLVTGRAKGTVKFEAFTGYASWKPHYILNLIPSTGSVEAQMLIKASQRTGLDYTGKITLHTKTPDERVTTPEVQPLRVGIKPKVEPVVSTSKLSVARTNRMYESARAEMMMAAKAPDEDFEEDDEVDDLPFIAKITETLADRTIDVVAGGENSLIGDGTERNFAASEGKIILSGKLELILIPEQRSNAWIIASMDEGNEHLIPGEAELRVDNHPSGKIFIGEYGNSQKRIPFGYANQITVEKEALVEKTGVSWFSGVFTSGYKLEVTNGTKDEQVITVKDRLPIPTDDKIKLDVKRIEPREKERDKENRLTWEITVPAGATVPVIVDYTLSYPSGEELLYK
ncbi:MAG: DUF4139 domain-containing protein, partial [Synergistaceae bacterium]|nr:DUF4139 domain-containing protein [Synergistaceae bacterium]